jgi:hypothetical protein
MNSSYLISIAHRALVEGPKILHRDVSIRNIMVHRTSDAQLSPSDLQPVLLGHNVVISHVLQNEPNQSPAIQSSSSGTSAQLTSISSWQSNQENRITGSPPTSPSVSSSTRSILQTDCDVPATADLRAPTPTIPSKRASSRSQGYLIDYDYSSFISKVEEEMGGHRTVGTHQFSADKANDYPFLGNAPLHGDSFTRREESPPHTTL